jgi:hypothetical protein
MAMALGRDNGDHLGVSYSLWATVLELAEQWGWRPVGTDPPRGVDRSEWGGSYYSSDGQVCRDEDARALADGISGFLRGRAPAQSRPPTDAERDQFRGFVAAAVRHTESPLCHPAGGAGGWLGTADGRDFLRRFVEFCQGGAFELS